MLAKKITSLQHPLVKHWAELRKTRAYREESGRVLIAGEKAIREFPFSIKSLIAKDPLDIRSEESFEVTEEILKKITGLENPGGCAAEVALPAPQEVGGEGFVLILDQLQDPGNLGTLLRTALALGWEGVVATPGTVDFFNDKALRAAQNAAFLLPYSWQSEEQIAAWAKNRPVWLADTGGEPLDTVAFRPPLSLILSSEGGGPREWAKGLGKRLCIPMQNDVESLNVAAAGAILLYAIRRPA